MLKLPVATLRPNVVPPILLDEFNRFSDLQVVLAACCSGMLVRSADD
jgi:hypothetical protein